MAGFIVVMNDGLAYDGVYTYKVDAEMVAKHYRKQAPAQQFDVQEAPRGFSMRHRDKIHTVLQYD
jgi:hypothetical protein